jgi:hypothetical protein
MWQGLTPRTAFMIHEICWDSLGKLFENEVD